jgi:hypothetical protein
VGDVFAVDLGEFKPNDDNVTKFADYLTENYIDENSTFPPSMWATITASSQRSTNAYESFHRILILILCRHISMFIHF